MLTSGLHIHSPRRFGTEVGCPGGGAPCLALLKPPSCRHHRQDNTNNNPCCSALSQIHLLQFHGTKYAAIDPSVVSAEELEVQKSRLGLSQEEP